MKHKQFYLLFSPSFGLVYNKELEDAIEDEYFKSVIKQLINVSTAYSLAVIMQMHRVEVANGVTCIQYAVVLTPSSVQLCYCCLINF